jgi:hypothetical protein
MQETRSQMAKGKVSSLLKEFNQYKNKTLKEIEKLTKMKFIKKFKTSAEFYSTTFTEWDHKFEVTLAVDKEKKVCLPMINSNFIGKPQGNEVVVKCYSHTELFDNKNVAIREYEEAAAWSDGCERERYLNILDDLYSDKVYCSD